MYLYSIKTIPPYIFSEYNCNKLIYRDTSLLASSIGGIDINNKGSVTVEAAIVVPFFLIAVITIMKFFSIINYYNVLQNSVNSTAKEVSRNMFYSEQVDKLNIDLSNYSDIDVDTEYVKNGLNLLYITNKIKNKEVGYYTNKLYIQGGTAALSTAKTNFNNESGLCDLWVNYAIKIKIFEITRYKLQLANRCYFRAWIGKSICDEKEELTKSKVVYITKSGTVYHTNRNCSYIDINCVLVNKNNIGNIKNASGKKYSECAVCAKRYIGNYENVYITINGTKYHNDKNCSEINRTVIEIDISEIGNRELCTKCKKSGG